MVYDGKLNFLMPKLAIEIIYNVLIMYQAKKRRTEEQFHSFLTLELGGGEWPASQPSCFTRRRMEE